MNVFYEEDGAFKVGTVLQDNTTSLQVEALHGKRAKIKSANVLVRFEGQPLAEFLAGAETLAAEMDTDFLWECCGPDEFGYEQLAKDYFGRPAKPVEAAALLLRLHGAPMYFYKRGKGRYKAAPEDALKAALASVEKKKRLAELQAQYVADLADLRLPEAFAPVLKQLLYKPDKNTVEWKALEEACGAAHLSPARLLEKCGALPSSHDYHFDRFLLEYFPRGTGFPDTGPVEVPADLPLAEDPAFSIDDAATTEIDDAFSVVTLPNGHYRVGVHIAAPALGMPPGSPVDVEARSRLSTVYMPGNKITMLPDEVIHLFTLGEERECPVLSMYLDVTPDSFEVVGYESRIERVRIAANLRHDSLEEHFNEITVAAGHHDYPFGDELRVLWRFANAREAARGKADTSGVEKVDYNFHVENDRIRITERKRGSPIDKVVSELMILVNSEWGRELADAGIPAIYRAQGNGKVRMTTSPAPHQGLGVEQYAWSSSPLRRYVDLVNQRQLVALLRGEEPPCQKGSEFLLTAMRDFEAAYDAYAEFQRGMERYWCLRWLLQEGKDVFPATVTRESLARIEGIPLTVRVPSMPEGLATGTRVLLELTGVDLLDIEVHFRHAGLAPEAAPD